ncbi:OmpA family protein [Brucella sp. NBRC 12950]|uniref:OmpA family protein n=1 Tax=Brucella sp. NBRC 12950 TaxID=2994518 RepID=UPI002557156D|nr:OmpA family protein [Brucella sp. NBRC 12950]
MIVTRLLIASRYHAILLTTATFFMAQEGHAQTAKDIPAIPAIVVPDFIGVEPAQQTFQNALGDKLSNIPGIRVAPARCDDHGALVSRNGMVLRDDTGITAEFADQGTYVIEHGGAGVADVNGVQFIVKEDGSGAINRKGEGGEQITIEADGSGSYNSAREQITLDGQGGGTWNSDQMGQVAIEPDGSGVWNGPLGQVVNEGNGKGSWKGEHVVINDGNGGGTIDGKEVEMAPLSPLPLAGKFPLLTKFRLPSAACGYLITLEDRILFNFDKADLRTDAAETVDALARALSTVAPKRLEIRGHTDAKGTEEYNLDLSKRRASTVKSALKDRNVSSEMEANGLGESQPVALNEIDGKDNPVGRQLNRRVEIFVPN